MNNNVTILDTTLRDGSYAINFEFSAQDTAIISHELESAGVKFIEIGHGVGLHASECGFGQALESDLDYMKSVSNLLHKAKFGFFCIPGIARLSDISLLADNGGGFIRIGTNVTEIHKSKEFIKEAKDHGLFVTANFMKSYVLEPSKFKDKVLESESYGVDLIYLVDSSGGMTPRSIMQYFYEIRKVSDIPLGFHGHNNLGCAVANSIRAAELGYSFIDASLQGLGRSSGNAPLEQLVAGLQKLDIDTDIDLLKIIDIGYNYIQPLLNNQGYMPLDIISGFADFHSSYMKHIHRVSSKYNINPLKLIIEYSKIDKVDMNEICLEKIAKKIHDDSPPYLGKYKFNRYIGGEQDLR